MLQLYSSRKNNDAISPVIAILLVVVVTIALTALLVSTITISPDTEPLVAEGVSATETEEGVKLQWVDGGNSETLQVNVNSEQLGELNEIGDSITVTAPENANITVTDDTSTTLYLTKQTTQDTTSNTGGTTAVVGESFFSASNIVVNSPGTQTISFNITEEEYIGETARIILLGDETFFGFVEPANEPDISYYASDISIENGNGELTQFSLQQNTAYFDYTIDESDIGETVTVEISDIHTRNSGSFIDDATLSIIGESEFEKQSQVEYDNSGGVPEEFINPQYATQNQLENGYNNAFVGPRDGAYIQDDTIVYPSDTEDTPAPQYRTGQIVYTDTSELTIKFVDFGETNEFTIDAFGESYVITQDDLNENNEYIIQSDSNGSANIFVGGFSSTEINEKMIIDSVELNNAEVRLFE